MAIIDPFRTVIRIPEPPFQLSHRDKLMSIGSCFSENIGLRFREAKFSIQINPFGQQYNPESVSVALQRLLHPVPYERSDLVHFDELYHSFHHHGSYSGPTVSGVLSKINTELQQQALAIREASALFLTFGTAHVFRLNETGNTVSNCHKMPASHFHFHMLEPDEMVATMHAALQSLRALNADVKVIFTVSPVRYFAFGHYENSVSKSHLFTAVHRLLKMVPNSFYFPAYEIVMDELRDYRFFAEDMLHPNHQATRYVWERTAATFFSKETLKLLQLIAPVVQAARHRPRNPNSRAHQNFIERNLKLCEELETTHGLDFTIEKELLRNGIS